MHKTHINISCVISVVTNGTQWKLGNTFSLSYLVDTTTQTAAHVDRCSRRLLAHIVIINLSSTLKFVNDIATWHDNVCVLCGYKFNNKHISNLLINSMKLKWKALNVHIVVMNVHTKTCYMLIWEYIKGTAGIQEKDLYWDQMFWINLVLTKYLDNILLTLMWNIIGYQFL